MVTNTGGPAFPAEHTTFVISRHPKSVGYWVLYKDAALKTQFAVYHKPTDEQIKNTEQLLGWHWLEGT